MEELVQVGDEGYTTPRRTPIEAGELPITLDTTTDQVLDKKIAVPYTTTQPTVVPSFNGTRYIYFDGTDYWYYVYANAGWRSTKLDSGGFPSSPSQGNIIYYNGTAWVVLATGTVGQWLRSGGASANVTWAGPAMDPQLIGRQHGTQSQVVADNATDITVYTLSGGIPAMGTNDMLEINIVGALSANPQANDLFKIKSGSTTLVQFTIGTGADTFVMTVRIYMRNSTSAEFIDYRGRIFETGATHTSNYTTAAVDLSASSDLVITYNIPVANDQKTFTLESVNTIRYVG